MAVTLPCAMQGPKRTSALQAPIMLLTGHGGEVFSMKFNPDGDVLASGSHDKNIFLWRTYGEECENYMVLKGGWANCEGGINSSATWEGLHSVSLGQYPS